MKRTYKSLRQFISKFRLVLAAMLLVFIIGAVTVIASSVPPRPFPLNVIVRINKDMTVTAAATLLEEKGLIRSSYLFKIYSLFLREGKGIQAGSYLFNEPQSVLRIAYRMAYGVKNIEKVKLTIFEGTNTKEIAAILKKNIPQFDSVAFLTLAQQYEGYLFPETYFVEPDVEPIEIITMMKKQFDVSIEPLKAAVATSTRSLDDILTMASIIEKEANNPVDRRMISGILWKRIDKGMALQVDVPFYYFLNKTSTQITLKDLATTSPYNTYLNKGLPPTPITNPGLDAIKAALYPTPSPYYFYLADRSGVTHYAANHDGHIINRDKYLQ